MSNASCVIMTAETKWEMIPEDASDRKESVSKHKVSLGEKHEPPKNTPEWHAWNIRKFSTRDKSNKKGKGHTQKAAHAARRAAKSKHPIDVAWHAGSAIKHAAKGPFRRSNFMQNTGNRVNRVGNEIVTSTSSPIKESHVLTNNGPTETKTTNGIRVTHYEEIMDLSAVGGAGTGFAALKLAANPGLAASFPWLSTRADGFEKYRFRKLKFYFITKVNVTSEGTVVMALDYAGSDELPKNTRELTNYLGSVAFPPYTPDTIPEVNLLPGCVMFGGSKYIRTGNVAGDPALFDTCSLVIAVSGIDAGHATSILGKVYASYVCDLMVPEGEPVFDAGTLVTALHNETFSIGAGQTSSLIFQMETYNGAIVNPLRAVIAAAPDQGGTPASGIYLPTGRYKFELTLLSSNVNAGALHWSIFFYIANVQQTHDNIHEYIASHTPGAGTLKTTSASSVFFVKDTEHFRVSINTLTATLFQHTRLIITCVS